ncbi:MAG TPA: hypothetical protein VFE53_24605 [Mucilaginibacter sp.]|jgi:hypothetical protein|nr:hypothetical protein [Mucilaginibacter sp.]
MLLTYDDVWKNANAAIKIKYNQTLPEHLSELYASSLRAKVPANIKFIVTVINGYNSLIEDINNNSNNFIVRARLKMLIEGLHGSINGASGIKKFLGMMFNLQEFERRKLSKALVADLLKTAILMIVANPVLLTNNAKTSSWKDSEKQYLDIDFITKELLEVPNKYL